MVQPGLETYRTETTDDKTLFYTDTGIVEVQTKARTKCEVYDRVMGYYRPVSEFNTGKSSEAAHRSRVDAEFVNNDCRE